MSKIKSRGYIQNRNAIQQVPEYNLRYQIKNKPEWGVQSPTDIDLVLEFQGKIIILVEYKKADAGMPKGQKRTLTTMVDAMQGRHTKNKMYQGKERYQGAYLVVAEHNTPGNTRFFDGAECKVREMYTNKKWQPNTSNWTVQSVVEAIFKHHNIEIEEYKQEFFNY